MTKCKGCPFLGSIKDVLLSNRKKQELSYIKSDSYVCALGYYIVKQESNHCKLEVVQYTLKDKRDSITFIPEVKCDEG